MFLIFISDLGEGIKEKEVEVLKFVDDTKVIKGIRKEEDIKDLQRAMYEIYKWQEDNNMSFNWGKFQLLRLGANLTLKEETTIFTSNMEEP